MELSGKDWQRFWQKVERGGPGECWEWKGGKGFHFKLDRTVTVMRIMWRWYHGEDLPAYRQVVRTCGNGRCVNPAHLEVFAPKEPSPQINIFYLAGLCGFDLVRVSDGRYRVKRR